MANQDGKGFRGQQPQYMTKDEIAEYFSRDIEFDWPESYEPRYPLTEGERKLKHLNDIGTYPRKLIWIKPELSPMVEEELGESPDKENT